MPQSISGLKVRVQRQTLDRIIRQCQATIHFVWVKQRCANPARHKTFRRGRAQGNLTHYYPAVTPWWCLCRTMSFRKATGSLTSRHGSVSERALPAACCMPAAAPLAVDDTFPQPATGNLVVDGPGLLNNDEIPCGSAAKIRVITNPGHGKVKVNSNGGFQYIPNPTASGLNQVRGAAAGLGRACCKQGVHAL